MLSFRLLKILSIPMTFGVYIRSNARLYDNKTKLFIYRPSLHSRIKKNWISFIVYGILKLVLLFKVHQKGDVNRFNLSLAFFLQTTLLFTIYGIPTFFEHDANRVFNAAITFYRFLLKEYMPQYDTEKSKTNKTIDALALQYIVVIFILNLLLWSFIIIFPKGPLTFGGLIPPVYYYPLVKWMLITSHCYGITILLTNAAIYGSNVLVYLVHLTLFLTRELRLGRKKYHTEDRLRTASRIVHVYRSFQVLHQNAMCFLGMFLVLCNAAYMSTAFYINFVLIQYWKDLHLTTKGCLVLGTCFCMSFWAMVLELGRAFYEKGNKVRGSWKGCKWNGSSIEKKIMKRFVRSCKPILISYGSQFVVGRVSVLVFFRGVVRGTMRCLLMTGYKFE